MRMGLAAEIRWSRSRNGLVRHAAVEPPAKRPASLTELLTINNDVLGRLMVRVSAALIIGLSVRKSLRRTNLANITAPRPAGLHLFNIGVAGLAFGISFNAWFAGYWRGSTVLVMCWAVTVGTAAIK